MPEGSPGWFPEPFHAPTHVLRHCTGCVSYLGEGLAELLVVMTPTQLLPPLGTPTGLLKHSFGIHSRTCERHRVKDIRSEGF